MPINVSRTYYNAVKNTCKISKKYRKIAIFSILIKEKWQKKRYSKGNPCLAGSYLDNRASSFFMGPRPPLFLKDTQQIVGWRGNFRAKILLFSISPIQKKSSNLGNFFFPWYFSNCGLGPFKVDLFLGISVAIRF